MTSSNGEHDEELLPEQVAELAAQMTEARSPSLRRRLARQVPELASRSRRGVQSGSEVSVRKLREGGQASIRGVRSGGEASIRGVRSSGLAAWTGIQSGGQFAGRGLQAMGRILAGQVLEMAPKIPIRSITTLREQHPGLETEQLADALVEGAARASAGFGGALGAAASLPFIPTLPVELGVETLALVGVELKLIAELHEVYGMPAPGNGAQRMLAYVTAWSERRGVRITSNGLAIAVGTPLWHKLERRLIAKAGQSTLSLAPLMAGAAAGAFINHRETRKLGNQVRDDLRKRSLPAG
jgi:hypothetical protein